MMQALLRTAFATSFSLLFLSLGNYAQAQRWTITDLGVLPGGSTSFAYKINDAGAIVGESDDAIYSGSRRPVVWNEGSIVPLRIPAGVFPSSVVRGYGINNAGQIVANLSTGGARWTNLTSLPVTLPGSRQALAINNNGVTAGYTSGPTLWFGDTPKTLNQRQGGGFAIAVAINNNDVAAGFANGGGNGNAFATIWNGTKPTLLESPPGILSSEARAINDARTVVGYGQGSAIVWDSSEKGSFLPNITGFVDSEANDINIAGDIIGSSSSDNGQTRRPILWRAGIPINLFTNSDASANGWTSGIASGINRSGKIVGWGTRNGENRAFLLSPTIEIVDPVSEKSSGLLLKQDINFESGLIVTKITTIAEDLSTKGRPVLGIAADGVAQVVGRIPAQRVGETFTISIETQCATAGSACIDSYGRAFDIEKQSAEVFGNTPSLNAVTVTSTATFRGPMAFFGYRAPVDFVRNDSAAHASEDSTARTRKISISVKGASNFGIDLDVIRAPVVLIHGLWADGTRSSYGDLWDLKQDSNFSTYPADYGSVEYKLLSNRKPTTEIIGEPTAKGGSFGFSFGARVVAEQLGSWHEAFRRNQNPSQKPVASSQFDAVAHSMGNLVARTLQANSYSITGNSIHPDSTYGRGYLHKLVSIGGPHLGSPFALEMSKEENKCIRNTLRNLDSNLNIFGAYDDAVTAVDITSGIQVYSGPGAVGDLSGAGNARGFLSPTLSKLKAIKERGLVGTTIPTAYVPGVMSAAQIDTLLAVAPQRNVCTLPTAISAAVCKTLEAAYDDINPIQLLRGICGALGDTFPTKIANATAYRSLMTELNDGVVPLESQINGLPGYPMNKVEQQLLHSPGTAALYQPLRSKPTIATELTPGMLRPSQSWNVLRDRVLPLLNTHIGNQDIFNR